MICTPIGIGSSGTGTATTGRPMNEIGWVWMPILARTGSSTPSSTNVTCPSFGATQGVAGAMITSTDLNSSSTLCAIPAAEFLRAVDQRRRHHRAGDQAIAHRRIEIVRALAQAVEMQRGAFGGGDDVGRGAGARGFGDFDRLAWHRAPWRRAPRPRPLRGTRSSGNSRRQSRSAGRAIPCASSDVTGSTGRVVQAASSASGPCIAS